METVALAVREAAREPWRESDKGARSADSRSPATGTEELGDEIALMAAHMHAYRRRYLALLAEFDRRRGWEPGGHRSCADWLAHRTGCDGNTAREHVRVARELAGLPKTLASMSQGKLSFSQVRALTRVANRYQDRNVRFFGIVYNDEAPAVREYVRRLGGQSYPALMDEGQRVAIDYGLVGVPETFFIAPDGKVRRKVFSAVDEQILVEEIEAMLNERGPVRTEESES